MSAPLRILQFGLGPIGLLTAEAVLDKAAGGRVQLVGAVDVNPAKVGRDVADLLAEEGRTPRAASGVIVRDDPRLAIEETRAEVVLHTTASFLDRVVDQIAECVDAGAHVVSSAEELAFPFERHPDIAERLDRLARQRGVAVVGTGVNPATRWMRWL
jgi:2,4-diaminopentanoate dehydrogenase